MAKVKDSAVLLAGSVVILELLTNRDTKKDDGAKVTVVAEDGLAVVKIRQENLHEVSPYIGQRVAWMVRNVAYQVDSNSGMSTQYVRKVTIGDLDLVNSILTDSAGKKAA